MQRNLLFGDSASSGESLANHHLEWLVQPGDREELFPYGYYGLYEDPYEYPEACQYEHLIFKAPGPAGVGPVTITLKADDNDFADVNDDPDEQEWERDYQSDDDSQEAEITVYVMEVSALTWEAYSDNEGLDTCTNNGGKRIFPGKKEPGDDAGYRDWVTLKVALCYEVPADASVTVTLRLFDVDDPKYSGSPVDRETPVPYNDNQCNNREASGTNLGASFSDGSQSSVINQTFTAGESEKEVTVYLKDLRPGNNWQVVAHEVGHQFQLNLTDDDNHPQTCIMHPFPTAATSFCDDCKAAIRGLGSP